MPVNLSCPHCNTTNRVPEDRLKDGPKCGRCKSPIFAGKAQTLHAGNVSAVLKNNDIPVLVDCWASWCGPCKQFAPVFEQTAAKYEPKLRCVKLDTQANQPLAGRWNIRSIPTLILFKGGKEVARMSGALSAPQLAQWLAQQGIR